MTLTPHPRFVSILYTFLFYSFCAFVYFLLYSLHLAVRYYIFFVTFSPQHNRRPPSSLDASGLLHFLKIKRMLKLMHKTAIFFVFFIFFLSSAIHTALHHAAQHHAPPTSHTSTLPIASLNKQHMHIQKLFFLPFFFFLLFLSLLFCVYLF